MTNRLLIVRCIATVVILAPVPIAAEESGVRQVTMNERTVISLTASIRNFTEINLPAGDPVRFASCGDPTFWNVEWVDQIVTVKPAKKGGSTNLTVRTMSGRSYRFRLSEGGPQATDLWVFVTDDSDPPGAPPRYVPAADLDALRLQLDEQRAQLVQARAAVDDERRLSDERLVKAQGEFSTRLHFDYGTPKYAAPFAVRAIWHDGRFTYIRSDAKELPTLYELLDGQPSLVNFDVRPGGTYVIGKVLDRGYLALGRKRWHFERR